MSETTHPTERGCESSLPATEKTGHPAPYPTGQRAILHCHFDGFFAAISQREHRAYRQRAVAIVAGQQRAYVLSCSWEAQQAGVRSGMPIPLARRYCPSLIVLQGDLDKYRRVAHEIRDIIEQQAPLFEQAAIDQYYLDLSALNHRVGSWQWAEELQKQLFRETALPLSIGLANSKLVARLGALHQQRPANAVYVAPGQERTFLSPLPTRKLPNIGQKIAQRLSFMGVRQIGVLASIPPKLLIAELGQRGRQIWEHANAIDTSPLLPYHLPKTLYHEIRFPEDTIEPECLHQSLLALLRQLGYSLRNKGRLAGKISVKITYADGSSYQRSRRLALTALDSHLQTAALSLLQAVFRRRLRLRLLGIELSALSPGQQQLDLFSQHLSEPPASPVPKQLFPAAAIENKFL